MLDDIEWQEQNIDSAVRLTARRWIS